jgi:hypothetical protein
VLETFFDQKYLGTGLETQNEGERVEVVSHIPTRTLSCPITTRTVSKKFPGNFP